MQPPLAYKRLRISLSTRQPPVYNRAILMLFISARIRYGAALYAIRRIFYHVAIRENSQMKAAIAVFAVLALILQTFSCTVKKTIQLDSAQVTNPAREKIVGVTTKSGEELKFDEPGALVRDQMLDVNIARTPHQIPINTVQRFWIERTETSTARTIGLVAGIAAGTLAVVAIVVAATKESCPFVYSWDGQRFVFDAEPYGGAITKGLERDDFSELERLVPAEGLYRLMLRNEVPETQYTNLMELVVVDHAAARVAMDRAGKLHTLASIQAPTAAMDDSGHDLLAWLKTSDGRIWETEPEMNPSASVRDEIRITFDKPTQASSAKLVANAATSLWGSYMIKAMAELRGNEIQSWYSDMDSNPLHGLALMAWVEREELFALKIDLEEPEGWVQRGLLLGGGPFVLEDRVLELDVSRVRGDQLKIRIRPPKGFWAFNSFGVDYSPDQPVQATTLRPVRARDSVGRDRLGQIAAADDLYYEMPELGDQAYVNFEAPASRPRVKRTVFLHTRGYYRLHIDENRPADTKTTTSIMTLRDAAARFSGSCYAAWQAQHTDKR